MATRKRRASSQEREPLPPRAPEDRPRPEGDRAVAAPSPAASPELRRYRQGMLALAAANLILVWALPVLPCQDLPQHLAYVRILMDHADPALPFHELYRLPAHFEPYHTTYHLLALLGAALSVTGALRVVMSAYVVGMLGAFHLLVRAAHRIPQGEVAWTPLLGVLVVWSPLVSLGLLPFVLAMPVLLAGCALFLRGLDDPPPRRNLLLLLASGAALASLHIVAAGCLLLFVVIHTWTVATERARALALRVGGAVLAATLIWSLWGGLGIGGSAGPPFLEAYNRAFGFEFLDELFQVTWQPPTVKLGYVLWTVLGPYRLSGQLLVAVALTAAFVLLRRAAPAPSPFLASPLRRTALVFALASLLIPWGLGVPTELTFLDLRLMTPAFALLLASVDPRRFAPERARRALLLVASFAVLHFGVRAAAFAAEAAAPLELVRLAQPKGMLLALPLHDRSAHFGKQFRLTHFLSMYYTVLEGGPSAQFWAQYTEHLPVDYQEGKAPLRPPDWEPWKLTSEHLEGKAWVLVEAPDEDDPRSLRADYVRLRAFLDENGETVRTVGAWSLHRLRPLGK